MQKIQLDSLSCLLNHLGLTHTHSSFSKLVCQVSSVALFLIEIARQAARFTAECLTHFNGSLWWLVNAGCPTTLWGVWLSTARVARCQSHSAPLLQPQMTSSSSMQWYKCATRIGGAGRSISRPQASYTDAICEMEHSTGGIVGWSVWHNLHVTSSRVTLRRMTCDTYGCLLWSGDLLCSFLSKNIHHRQFS